MYNVCVFLVSIKVEGVCFKVYITQNFHEFDVPTCLINFVRFMIYVGDGLAGWFDEAFLDWSMERVF